VRRPSRVGALAALAAVLLAGCVSIPTSGGVQSEQIDAGPDEVDTIALPERPQPGQSAAQIVQGFLRAGRGPQNNYAIAQEYLAPGVVWSGIERVLVASSIGLPVEVDPGTFSVSVVVVAEVDQHGRYVALPLATTQTLTFELAEVDGEQRILTPPPGTVLTSNGFGAAFRSYALYFFDPSFRYLVPEVHWFPTPRVTNRIVSELVQGQGEWLGAGVLQSAFPEGTTASAVPVESGVEVTLNAEVRAESALIQLRMIQQLSASLTSVGNVSAADVVVTAGGLALAPASAETVPQRSLGVRELIGGVDGAVRIFTPDGTRPIERIELQADELGAQAVSLSRERDVLAVLGAAGVSVIRVGSGPVLIDSRPGLVAPTVDPFGFVWTVPADDPGALLVTGQDGVSRNVPIGADGRVTAIELSRDGSRLLVALETVEGSRLFVVGVQRDAELVPIALHTPFDLRPDGTVLDIAWVDGERVAALVADGGDTRVQLLTLGGPVEGLGVAEDAIAIVGGTGELGLRALTSAGVVLRPTTVGGWTPAGFEASFLGTQQ